MPRWPPGMPGGANGNVCDGRLSGPVRNIRSATRGATPLGHRVEVQTEAPPVIGRRETIDALSDRPRPALGARLELLNLSRGCVRACCEQPSAARYEVVPGQNVHGAVRADDRS